MTVHVLKTREPYFTEIVHGLKTFEVRRNDRAYQAGDTLQLVQSDGSHGECTDPTCGYHKPKHISKVVTFVFSGDPSLRDCGGILPGYVVLALADPTEGA